MKEPAVHVSLDTILVESGGQTVCLDGADIYKRLTRLAAKERIESLLTDKGYSADTVSKLVDDRFVDKWLYANKNNSTVIECEMLAAILIAYEQENEQGKSSPGSES